MHVWFQTFIFIQIYITYATSLCNVHLTVAEQHLLLYLGFMLGKFVTQIAVY
jgi:hypothetical protein